MNIKLTGDCAELKEGLKILKDEYRCSKDIEINCVKTTEFILKVSYDGNKAEITFSEKAHFFRGVGLLFENISYGKDSFTVTEHPRFTMCGSMYDIAQSNAVINTDNVKNLLRKSAVMGLNMFMLYCEDNYEVKEYPYFGYMRGRYTGKEMKMLDDYAYALGIELIPCIQTLAHLKDALRWNAYNDMKMDADTLLVGEEKVYEFIDALIKSASENVRTKRIHIGMDEAFALGEGKYLAKNGYRNRFDIMLEHLGRVREIVNKYGLKPMIWSDMFFSSAIGNSEYYSKDCVIPPKVLEAYPKDVTLVYWDYYRDDKEFYREYIAKHRAFGTEPVFAGGVHTWYSIAPWEQRSIDYTDAALQVCAEEGIKEVFCTIWGDDNTEAHIYTTLQGLQLFAEINFNGPYNEQEFAKRFKYCTDINLDDFKDLAEIECLPGHSNGLNPGNVYSKAFMWLDVLLGFDDKFFDNGEGEKIEAHYRSCADRISSAKTRNGEFNNMYEYYELVCRALEYKASIGNRLIGAYKQGKSALKQELPRLEELKKRMTELKDYHRKDWYMINKPFGWEVMEQRYATVIMRTDTAIFRINEYLNGTVDKLEELEAERLAPDLFINAYSYLFSASRASII